MVALNPRLLLTRPVNHPSDRFPFSHGANLTLLPDGRLACVWFAGSLEGHIDTAILLSILDTAEGASEGVSPAWSEPLRVADEPDCAVGNPVLFCATATEWHLFYTAFPPRQGTRTHVRVKTSQDGGHTWCAASTLDAPVGSWTRHPLLALATGNWLLPLCDVARRPTRSSIWRTGDGGKTWVGTQVVGSDHRIQPSLIALTDRYLQVYFRDVQSRFVYRSESSDLGCSWQSPTPTLLRNNNSSIQALQLSNACVAVALNNQDQRRRRSPLHVAISADAGETWPSQVEIEPYWDLDASVASFSYPSLVRTADGLIHVAYTDRAERIAHAVVGNVGEPSQRRLVADVADQLGTMGYVVRHLRAGEPQYSHNKDILRSLPASLDGQLAVCTVGSDEARGYTGARFLRLKLSRPATITVAYDAQATSLPAWLADFRQVDGMIVSVHAKFRLFSRDFASGEHYFAGNCQAPASGLPHMYFLFAVPTHVG